ncbi:hypothetical protein [Spongiivirga citrea]|uniref:Uncharacterized protein n=1 Tax=Spongiivirga citrea TaxID=1481457 RepID=A0A6M0CGS7_9FLAO|nr:hypothetical protein [Spongiivirga citrea]NER17128.1 hypothetical protein [Spongiivirga citrea]
MRKFKFGLICFVLLGTAHVCIAQHDWKMERTIGFSCNGSRSAALPKIEKLLISESPSEIGKLIYSENIVEQYFGIFYLKISETKISNIISKTEKERIDELFDLNEKVGFCAGCKRGNQTTLKEIFEGASQHILYSTKDWFNKTLKNAKYGLAD